MVKVVWTASAIQDLDDIGGFIAKDSIKYAEIIVENLFNAPDILDKFPKAGRIVPEFNDKNIRELINGSYRIVYRIVNESRVDILSIHHSARLMNQSSIKRKNK